MPFMPEYVLSAGNMSGLGLIRKELNNKDNLTTEDLIAYKYSFQQGE